MFYFRQFPVQSWRRNLKVVLVWHRVRNIQERAHRVTDLLTIVEIYALRPVDRHAYQPPASAQTNFKVGQLVPEPLYRRLEQIAKLVSYHFDLT